MVKEIGRNHRPAPSCRTVREELLEKEIHELDMRAWGVLVYDRTLVLSHQVNQELLEPISQWLDDHDWMTRFKVYEEHAPNWAEYKRKQREWTAQQKKLAREKLKLYWQEIRRKRSLRTELGRIIGKSRGTAPSLLLNSQKDFITPIVAPFSPVEQKKRKTEEEFKRTRELRPSDLLPWKVLLLTELRQKRKFKELREYLPKKQDTVAKLLHLLQMETEGLIQIYQSEPFDEIEVNLQCSNHLRGSVTIKDQAGEEYNLDWSELNDAQKNKVIADLKGHTIVCKM